MDCPQWQQCSPSNTTAVTPRGASLRTLKHIFLDVLYVSSACNLLYFMLYNASIGLNHEISKEHSYVQLLRVKINSFNVLVFECMKILEWYVYTIPCMLSRPWEITCKCQYNVFGSVEWRDRNRLLSIVLYSRFRKVEGPMYDIIWARKNRKKQDGNQLKCEWKQVGRWRKAKEPKLN